MGDAEDAVELGWHLGRWAWRIAGPFTLLLGLAGLGRALVEAFGEDPPWVLGSALLALLYLAVGWLADLATRLLLRPLAGALGVRGSSVGHHVVIGLPALGLAVWLLWRLG